MTMAQFRERLIAFGEQLCGSLLSLPEVDEAIAEATEIEELEEDDPVPLRVQWEVFTPAASEFSGATDDDLLTTLLTVWAGPYPEEQFLDQDELVEALAEGSFPKEFRKLIEEATTGYTQFDEPPTHAALFSEDWGWALAYPKRVLRFRTPLELLEHLAKGKRAK